MTVQTLAARPASAPAVKCGNRRQHGRDGAYHPTTADVRACFGGSFRQVVEVSPLRAGKTALSQSWETEQIEKQAQAKRDEENRARCARYDAWRTIPVYARDNGYYALTDSEGTVRFFKVSRPSRGKYAGRTFIKIQASDDFHDMPWHTGAAYLDQIAKDPETAGILYGQEIQKCFMCHRTLTDADSRARGFGPDCAKKVGA